MSAAGRCGSEQRSRYFPSRFASVLILALSMRSSPPGVTRRYRFSPGLVEIFPRSSPRFITGRLSDPAINSVSWATSCSRMCASRVAASGLWQITTPLGVRHPDFLDPHVPRDLGVAALPGEGGFDLRGLGAQLLADDVGVIALAQVAAVVLGAEPAVGDPHDLRQGPVPHVVFHLADQRGIGGVAGPAPHPAPGSRRG